MLEEAGELNHHCQHGGLLLAVHRLHVRQSRLQSGPLRKKNVLASGIVMTCLLRCRRHAMLIELYVLLRSQSRKNLDPLGRYLEIVANDRRISCPST